MAYAAKVDYGGAHVPITTTLYGVCTALGGEADKNVMLTDVTNLIVGMTIKVKFSYANTAMNPRLLINNTDAKPIMRNGNAAVGIGMENSWPDGSIVSLTYDGTCWMIDGWLNTDTNTTYTDATTSQHGLMSTADKTKLDRMDIVTYTEVEVAKEAWAQESQQTYSGYSFKAELALTAATTDHVPYVTFAPEQIETYGPAPVAVSGAGIVTVYVETKPTATIKIPTVQLIKG